MEYYFNQFGDHIPNSKDEIHLDPIDKLSIYEEYTDEMDLLRSDTKPISYEQFLDMWRDLFPYVTIREFKAVTGAS